MRTVSLREFVLEEFNRMLEDEGRDVRISAEQPRPQLVAEVVEFRRHMSKEQTNNDAH